MTDDKSTTVQTDVWEKCYGSSWDKIIVSEAMAHPAKFSKALIFKIIQHALDEGFVQPGDTVLDPFGGVGLGARPCIAQGMQWIGVELEQNFIDLGQGCDCTGITKPEWVQFYGRWQKMRYQGSRHWCPACMAQTAQVTGERQLTKRTFHTRPREGRGVASKTVLYAPLPFPDRRDGVVPPRPHSTMTLFASQTASYERGSGRIPHTTQHHYEGNIERWAREGYSGATLVQGDSRDLSAILEKVEVCVSSPPYVGSANCGEGIDFSKVKPHRGGGMPSAAPTAGYQGWLPMRYGQHPAQLGNLAPGSLSAAIASPPYSDALTHGGQRHKPGFSQGQTHGIDAFAGGYGTAPGQLEGLPAGSVDACLSSPPYAGSTTVDGRAITDAKTHTRPIGSMDDLHHGYGQTEGQLAALPTGQVADCVINSPPYADRCANDNQRTLTRDGLQQGHNEGDGATYGTTTGNLSVLPTGGADPQPQHIQGGAVHHVAYGASQGQLGALAEGTLQACVSSPPFCDSDGRKGGSDLYQHNQLRRGRRPDTPSFLSGASSMPYGTHPDQLGNTQGTTFWEAARTILEQVYAVLKPGGVAIWVTKMYVRDGQLVDFPGDWRRLAEHCGFVTLHEHHALLTEHHGTQRDLDGADVDLTTSRISFFRRLAEAKGSPKILWETVYCMRKPASMGMGYVDLSVASPPYAESLNDATNRINWSKVEGGRRDRTQEPNYCTHRGSGITAQAYGTTAGQLGAMPVGAPDCLISSPPYAESLSTETNGIDRSRSTVVGGTRESRGKFQATTYGSTPGQLASLPPGQPPARED